MTIAQLCLLVACVLPIASAWLAKSKGFGKRRRDGGFDNHRPREWLARQRGVLELTHNHGTESQDGPVYHDGNSDPRGFGHICVSVPDVQTACARFEALGVPFQKRLSDGSMKSLAFIKDPDGYWVEIIQPTAL